MPTARPRRRAALWPHRDAGFVQAGRLSGNGEFRILLVHILPNIMPIMIVQMSLTMGYAILNAAGLSFIGLGVRPPTAEWGIMVAEGAGFMVSGEWWIALFPGLALTLLYWAVPGRIVHTVFGEAYAAPGMVLALVGLATTLYAGVNIWLNYALSLNRHTYIYALAVIVAGQIGAMLLFHARLESIALIMILTGITANLAGLLTTFGNNSHAP